MKSHNIFKYHFLAIATISAILTIWSLLYYPAFPATIISSLITVVIVFVFVAISLPKPTPFILNSFSSRAIPTVLSTYGIAFFWALIFRIDYSRPILIMGMTLTTLWFLSFYLWKERKIKAELYVVGKPKQSLKSLSDNIKLLQIDNNTPLSALKSGVLVDLHSSLSSAEERIIADCTLAQIPIYHVDLLSERLNHRVSDFNLSHTSLKSMHPNVQYAQLKVALEKTLIIALLPIILPIALFISLAIFAQRDGPVLFRQTRVGQHNKVFTLFKFRTMADIKAEQKEAFATHTQHRVSTLGRFLRSSRLDELPQLWNVLKGEMSIIGPRPEQPNFAKQYSLEIPFYSFRHTLKPGITGWAQVTQGYTDSTETTKAKLAYDLYYLKYFSWRLDFEIYVKTIGVMLTGKGAK
ncbi:sugar transferase [Vibrio maerlii]|uniref:sugar transferase n=1 Tax=Vibrio maerlii TaxID=2231648 RepID=UPI001F13B85F|nr:sugar transferase [Vibrio maerlii]